MYIFSKVPNQPYIDTQHFKDLKVLDENWEMIRDEAKALYDQGGIKASSTYNDLGFNSFFKTGWKRFTSSGMNRVIHLLLSFAQKLQHFLKHCRQLKQQCLPSLHLTAVW